MQNSRALNKTINPVKKSKHNEASKFTQKASNCVFAAFVCISSSKIVCFVVFLSVFFVTEKNGIKYSFQKENGFQHPVNNPVQIRLKYEPSMTKNMAAVAENRENTRSLAPFSSTQPTVPVLTASTHFTC